MELFKLFGTIAVNNDDANSAIDETTGRVQQGESKMSSAFKKIGAAVAAAFAVDRIVAFGKSIVNAAAEVDAETSAFSQIMGNYTDNAREKLNEVADSTGVMATRMQGHFTSLSAKFKGLGFDVEDATDLAQRGLTLAADAAAFWDKSLDESSSHLNSFINGSYEGGEAIGLLANDTQMAMYAVQQGIVEATKDWASLDEATKQATRLEYAENMYAQSGATGQAAREADQYANVQANLTEKWRQFKAQIGEPLLQNVVIPAMEVLSTVVDTLSTKFEALKQKVQNVGSYLADTFSPAWEAAKDLFAAVKDALQPLIDKLSEYVSSGQSSTGATTDFKNILQLLSSAISEVLTTATSFITWLNEGSTGAEILKAAVVSLAAGFAAYKAILIATNTWQQIVSATTKIVTAAQAALNAVMNANPIALIVVAIAGLVAAFIYLWNNCEGFRNFWIGLWEGIKTAFEPVITTIKEAFDSVKEKIQSGILPALEEFWSAVQDNVLPVLSSIWDYVQIFIQPAIEWLKTGLENLKIIFKTVFEVIKTIVSTVFANIKVVITTVWNNIKIVISTALDVIKNVIKLATSIIKGDWQGAWDAIKNIFSSVWNGIKSVVSNVWNAIKSIFSNNLNAIKTSVSTIFDGIKSVIQNTIDGAKNIVNSGLNAIKNFFSNLKLSFPSIKLPHFSVTGKFSLSPLSVPKFSISWYKKAMDNAMLLNSPTIFGMNPAGQFMGGGEAGQEVVAGSSTLMNMIRGAVKTETSGTSDKLERLISILERYFPELLANMGNDIVMDDGVLVGRIMPRIDRGLGEIDRLRGRGQ